jgi:hypothetical protein
VQVFLLEGENRKLVRALVREVGEEVPLAKVVDEGSDWKGRREQIIHLKDTIKQLREAAAAAAPASDGPAGLPAAANSSSSLAKHENAHRSVIGKLNKERGAEFERMAGELAAAQREKEQLRLQYAGAASRRKVLEAEVGAGALLAAGSNRRHSYLGWHLQTTGSSITGNTVQLACQQQGRASCSGCKHQLPAVQSAELTLDCLCPQVVVLKDKLAVVLGKTQNDDKLIAALRSELAMAGSRGKAGGAGSSAG